MNSDFSVNLRLLCSYYKSIAEVCRKLDFNRAQFNRYLNGTNKPGAHTMMKICDLFGVDEFEILMPHNQFKLLIQVRPKTQSNDLVRLPEHTHLEKLEVNSSSALDRYLGYYFEYHISMANPGKLLRTLVCVEKRGNKVYYQRTERIFEPPQKKVYHGVYLGLANFLVDRIFLVDYESLTAHEVSQTILFPSFRNRISKLKGLKMGVSGSGERMPVCMRVIYEFLGTSINLKSAFSLCGLYDLESTDIDPYIRDGIRNDILDNEWHFRARH